MLKNMQGLCQIRLVVEIQRVMVLLELHPDESDKFVGMVDLGIANAFCLRHTNKVKRALQYLLNLELVMLHTALARKLQKW